MIEPKAKSIWGVAPLGATREATKSLAAGPLPPSPPPEEASGEARVVAQDGGGEDLAASLLAEGLGRRGSGLGWCGGAVFAASDVAGVAPRLLGREGGE